MENQNAVDDCQEKPAFFKRRWVVWLIRLLLIMILCMVAWFSFVLWYNDKISQYTDWSDGMGISKDKQGKFGYVNDHFQLKINHQFDYAEPFDKGFAITGINYGKAIRYRVIDKNGRYVGEFYDSITALGENLYAVKNRTKLKTKEQFEDNQWQVMDSTGKIVSKRIYHAISPFHEQRARVCIGNQCGFIDTKAHEIVPLSDKVMDTKTVYDFSKSLDGKPTNDSNFSNGLGLYFSPSEKSYGYLDKNGNIVIAPQFSHAKPFSEGFAVVEQHGGLGVIDTTGNFVKLPDRNIGNIEQFSDNRAIFKLKDNPYAGVIDNAGNEIVSPNRSYTSISRFKQGYAVFTYKGLQGVIDNSGKEIIPPLYSDLVDLGQGNGVKDGRFRAMLLESDKPESLFINPQNKIVLRKKLTVMK